MLQDLLQTMTRRARELGWTDRHWALTADVRPETLSRMRRRGGNGDAATLERLAQACGLELVARDGAPPTPMDESGLFPQRLGRDLEEHVLALCASGDVEPAHWRALGPSFFMGGLAAMLSCTDDLDPESRYAGLAESLHPGVLGVDTFRLWLRRSPVKASRFLPMLRKRRGQYRPMLQPAPSPPAKTRHARQ
jgi:hypothetical protein